MSDRALCASLGGGGGREEKEGEGREGGREGDSEARWFQPLLQNLAGDERVLCPSPTPQAFPTPLPLVPPGLCRPLVNSTT